MIIFDIIAAAAVEGLLITRNSKVLGKRVSGVNVTDEMLRMVRRLLLVTEIEQFVGNFQDPSRIANCKE